VDAVRQLDRAGLNLNASGNVSIRVGPHVLVTPSGIPASRLEPDDGVVLSADGAVVDGIRQPTSEWRIHLRIMRDRPQVMAVVHTHSPEATAASTLRRPIPPVHYVAARFGAPALPCAGYATYGSEELADNVAEALKMTGTACLMANHGALALGATLDAAVALALDVEWFCGVHRRALQLSAGEMTVLSEEEIATVATLFRSYGRSSG
jgi:L-fuculose-phosphate aldolase